MFGCRLCARIKWICWWGCPILFRCWRRWCSGNRGGFGEGGGVSCPVACRCATSASSHCFLQGHSQFVVSCPVSCRCATSSSSHCFLQRVSCRSDRLFTLAWSHTEESITRYWAKIRKSSSSSSRLRQRKTRAEEKRKTTTPSTSSSSNHNKLFIPVAARQKALLNEVQENQQRQKE
jgi:hypothetical protein